MASTQRSTSRVTGAASDNGAVPPAGRSVPSLAWVSLGLSIIGLGLSAYLTYEHFTGNATLSCPANATVNCEKVTTSQWSEIVGVPVAVLGLFFFVVMTVGCLPAFWRTRQFDIPRVVAAFVGIASAIYLVWIELFAVNAICLWCTGVHVVTLLLLAAVLWTTAAMRSHEAEAAARRRRPSGRR